MNKYSIKNTSDKTKKTSSKIESFSNNQMYVYEASRDMANQLTTVICDDNYTDIEKSMLAQGFVNATSVEEYKKNLKQYGEPISSYMIKYDREKGGYYMDVRFMNFIVKNTILDFIGSCGLSFPMHANIMDYLIKKNECIFTSENKEKTFNILKKKSHVYNMDCSYDRYKRRNIENEMESDSYLPVDHRIKELSNNMLSLVLDDKLEFDLIKNDYFKDNVFLSNLPILHEFTSNVKDITLGAELVTPLESINYKSAIGFRGLIGHGLFISHDKIRIYRLGNKPEEIVSSLDLCNKMYPYAPISLNCFINKVYKEVPNFILEVNGKPMICIIDTTLHTLNVDNNSKNITVILGKEYAAELGVFIEDKYPKINYTFLDDTYICKSTIIKAKIPMVKHGDNMDDKILPPETSTEIAIELQVITEDCITKVPSSCINAAFISPSCFINGLTTANMNLDLGIRGGEGQFFFHQ